MDRPSTSTDKETILGAAKQAFESSYSTPTLNIKIEVQRRKRGVKHVAKDILFVVSFSSPDGANQPLLNFLVGVYESILTLIRKLKRYFDDSQRRLVFSLPIYNP